MTPLRQRMLDDMRIRNFTLTTPGTIHYQRECVREVFQSIP